MKWPSRPTQDKLKAIVFDILKFYYYMLVASPSEWQVHNIHTKYLEPSLNRYRMWAGLLTRPWLLTIKHCEEQDVQNSTTSLYKWQPPMPELGLVEFSIRKVPGHWTTMVLRHHLVTQVFGYKLFHYTVFW